MTGFRGLAQLIRRDGPWFAVGLVIAAAVFVFLATTR